MKQFKIFLDTDKLLHTFLSGWLFFALMVAFNSYDIAIFTSVIFFIGKEIYDQYFKKTVFDVVDALASLLGVAVSLVYWDLFS